LVVGLATLESVLEATAALRRAALDWRLSQVSIARGRELGGRIGWEALNPVHVLAALVPR
jgi:precorrin-6B methylase 2